MATSYFDYLIKDVHEKYDQYLSILKYNLFNLKRYDYKNKSQYPIWYHCGPGKNSFPGWDSSLHFISLPMTDSFYCHLDDRRGPFVRRDFSSRTLRNDSADAAFCHFQVVPNKIGWYLRMTVSYVEMGVTKGWFCGEAAKPPLCNTKTPQTCHSYAKRGISQN